MLATYEAPKLTLYGSVAAITSSAKCSPGADALMNGAQAATSDPAVNTPYGDGTTMIYVAGGASVPTGTQCWNTTDPMTPFKAG